MVIAIGNTLVDQLVELKEMPASGEKRSGHYLGASPGGGAANSAVVAASLGAPTKLYTSLGNDFYGATLKDCYRELGITTFVQACPQTPISLVFVDQDRERTLLTLKPVLEPQAEEFTQPFSAVDDYVLIYAHSHQARKAFAEKCPGKLALPGRYLQAELDAGSHWDIVLASADDTDLPSAEELAALQCQLFIRTSGSQGGSYWDTEGWHEFRPHPISADDIVDTCGAGDAFAGGVLAGLDSGLSHAEAINQGAEAGAACVTRSGAWPKVPYPLKPLLPS